MTTGFFNQRTIPNSAFNEGPEKSALLVIVFSLITLFSFLGTPGFGEQASVRPVSALLNAATSAPDCQIFCIGTRAHGIEFYTGRFVYESVDKADLALAPRDDQKYRLIKNDDQWEKNISLDDPVYLVTTRTELTKLTRKWRELGSSGSYLLLELEAVD